MTEPYPIKNFNVVYEAPYQNKWEEHPRQLWWRLRSTESISNVYVKKDEHIMKYWVKASKHAIRKYNELHSPIIILCNEHKQRAAIALVFQV